MSLYGVGVPASEVQTTFQASAAVPTLIRASKTFTGAANLGAVGNCPLFSNTGAVVLQSLYVRCLTTLTDTVDGAEFRIGTTNELDLLWDGTTATGTPIDLDLIVANKWLKVISGTPSVDDHGGNLLGNAGDAGGLGGIAIDESVTLTVSVQAISSGVLAFYAFYTPLSSDGALTLGTGMVKI